MRSASPSPSTSSTSSTTLPKIKIVNGEFKDESGREVFLRGINFAADAKFPYHENSDSFVNSPVPLSEADTHYQRLRDLGFNCLRYIYTWDALEHAGPGQYDEEYIDYTIKMLQKARDYGFYIIMDPHQDVWSRHSGGSGAPLWTLHLVGLNPQYFQETHAAELYHKNAAHAQKMIWASNYHRLVSQTMFTLFFAGEDFAPDCKINGINVGTYLHDHYLNALVHFARRVNEADLGSALLGWESMNEPGHGLIAYEHLDKFPSHPGHVKLGRMPTPFGAMLLGNGEKVVCEYFRFTAVGTRNDGPREVYPNRGTWFDEAEQAEIDAKHGWQRSWSGCPWAHQGIYDLKTKKLLKPLYFTTTVSGEKLPEEHAFIDIYFVRHWQQFISRMQPLNEDWFMFMQSPVNMAPPHLVQQNIAVDLSRTVYTPHYYDGMTLMLKRWRAMNVDAVGVLRDKYSNPAMAVRVGASMIRNSFIQQLAYIKEEGRRRLGDIPCLMSEIGIPYDLDDKAAFATGQYDNQVRAMDCNHWALESNKLHHCLWTYAACNTHEHGDLWNGEDLSIWSHDDYLRDSAARPRTGSVVSTVSIDSSARTEPLKRKLRGSRGSRGSTSSSGSSADGSAKKKWYKSRDKLPASSIIDKSAGVRAAPAVIRPTPVATAGSLEGYSFDLYKATFTMEINGAMPQDGEANTTLVFLPEYYYRHKLSVTATSGTFSYDGRSQILSWHHEAGKQKLTAVGKPQFSDSISSYFDPLVRVVSDSGYEIRRLARRFLTV